MRKQNNKWFDSILILLFIEHMYGGFLKAADEAIQLNRLPESDTSALLEKRQQILNDLYKSLRLDDEKTEQKVI